MSQRAPVGKSSTEASPPEKLQLAASSDAAAAILLLSSLILLLGLLVAFGPDGTPWHGACVVLLVPLPFGFMAFRWRALLFADQLVIDSQHIRYEQIDEVVVLPPAEPGWLPTQLASWSLTLRLRSGHTLTKGLFTWHGHDQLSERLETARALLQARIDEHVASKATGNDTVESLAARNNARGEEAEHASFEQLQAATNRALLDVGPPTTAIAVGAVFGSLALPCVAIGLLGHVESFFLSLLTLVLGGIVAAMYRARLNPRESTVVIARIAVPLRHVVEVEIVKPLQLSSEPGRRSRKLCLVLHLESGLQVRVGYHPLWRQPDELRQKLEAARSAVLEAALAARANQPARLLPSRAARFQCRQFRFWARDDGVLLLIPMSLALLAPSAWALTRALSVSYLFERSPLLLIGLAVAGCLVSVAGVLYSTLSANKVLLGVDGVFAVSRPNGPPMFFDYRQLERVELVREAKSIWQLRSTRLLLHTHQGMSHKLGPWLTLRPALLQGTLVEIAQELNARIAATRQTAADTWLNLPPELSAHEQVEWLLAPASSPSSYRVASLSNQRLRTALLAPDTSATERVAAAIQLNNRGAVDRVSLARAVKEQIASPKLRDLLRAALKNRGRRRQVRALAKAKQYDEALMRLEPVALDMM